MPKQYEAIKNQYLKKGKSDKDAKTIAAKIFIARGAGAKSPKGRSARAKQLHED